MWRDEGGQQQHEIREFQTHTRDLGTLAEWLRQNGVEQVAMEATGSYWRPVWNVLEAQGFRQTLANAQHIRAVPGRKTDTQDAQWIADRLRHGLVPASFVPHREMRHLRDLTRMRSKLVQDHTRVVNRIQAVLEDANVKLSGVVSDIMGASAQAMLRGLLQGSQSPAELAQGRMRSKRAQLRLALEGRFQPQHAFLLNRLLITDAGPLSGAAAKGSEPGNRTSPGRRRAAGSGLVGHHSGGG